MLANKFESTTLTVRVRSAASDGAPLLTEALKGERITIYDIGTEGWAWGQLAGDGYVGQAKPP